MWGTPRAAPQHDIDLHSAMTEMVQEITRNLIYITSGAYLAVQFLVGIFGDEELALTILFLSPILALPAGLALHLLPRHLLLAQVLWQTGLMLLITVALIIFRQPEIAYLYTLLPFMAAITMGEVASLVVQVGISALVFWQTYYAAIPSLSSGHIFHVLAGGIFTGLVGWAASRTLYMVTGWSLQSFAQAQRSLEEARQHRAQLAQVLKDLDQAYYRLERTNAATVAAWRAASEAEQFKAQFATRLSHELRTPLNLVVGFAEMMLTAPHKYEGAEIPRPYRKDLDAIYRNAHHLEALIDDVLDLARLDAGRLPLAPEEADIALLVAETISMVREYMEAKGLDLQVRIASNLPTLRIDHLRIRQVLLNLLVNAARFTETGWIRVEAAPRDNGVILHVTDTGRGIPEHELPRIFDEFRQGSAPPASTGWAGGTGLGLPISRKLVELHGGQMGVESTYLKGTTFWFTLPCLASPVTDQAPVSSPIRAEPPWRLRADRRLIVVVHEDARVVDLLQRYLEGYRLVPSGCFDEGLAIARESKAIALIGDLPMLQRDLCRDLIGIRCPLPNPRDSARLLGAQDLLVKPISSDALWRAIEGLGRPIRRVLVADDEPDMVRLIQQMLVPRIAPQDCLEAYNGEDALAILRSRSLDLLLLDLMMPRLTGQEVLAQMVRESDLASTAVIIISAKEQEEVELCLPDPLQVAKGGGLHLSELARVLEANLNVLAPGWHQEPLINHSLGL